MKSAKSPLDWFPGFMSYLGMVVWGFVMIVLGLLAMLEYPHRFQPITTMQRDFVFAAGAVSLGLGEFVIAVVARMVFPAAHPKVAGAFELAPWVGLLLAALSGVALWIIRA